MPRYLRWLMAVSSGITAQFAYFVVVGAIAVGTGNKEVSLNSTTGLALTIGATFVSILPALAVNDWLAKRYPRPSAERAIPEKLPESIEN